MSKVIGCDTLSSQGTYKITINTTGRITAYISVTSKRYVSCKLSQVRGVVYRSLPYLEAVYIVWGHLSEVMGLASSILESRLS